MAAGLALFLDLFLPWREVSVRAGGFALDTSSSAWANGWGLAAGIVVSVLIILELPLLATRRATAGSARALLVAGLGMLILALTVAAFAEASVEVTTPMTSVEVASRLWPAYVGLVLAALIALAGLVQLVGRDTESTVWRPGQGLAR